MSLPTAGVAPHAPSTFRGGLPRLPRGLADDAEASVFADPAVAVGEALPDTVARVWRALAAVYTPTSGPLRLGRWECVGDQRLDPRPRTYRATLAFGDRIDTATVSAPGPVAALTAMLHDRGIAVETLQLHQLVGDDATTTFIRGSDGHHAAWAMGVSADAGESVLRAVIACANRLLASGH